MKTPQEIVSFMYGNDEFSSLLGIEIVAIKIGNVDLELSVKESHTNGFKIAHGGISYSLADTCLAFSANTFGYKAVTTETSISYFCKVQLGDRLCAKSHLIQKGNSSAVYLIEIHNQENILVSHFKGTVRISKDLW